MGKRTRDAIKGLGRAIDWTTTQVRDVHLAIAKRPYEVLAKVPIVAEGAALVEPVHLGITKATYGAVRVVAKGVVAVADEVLSRVDVPDPDLDDHGTLAVLNAVAGHEIDIGVTMGFRVSGKSASPAELECGAHVVIFVHGLACDERSWGFYSETAWGKPGVSYGALLAEKHGWSPLYVRYNTGLDIDENGLAFAKLLDELVLAHPDIASLSLVGHSMGGLVIGRACDEKHAWNALVRHVACLGSPHLGAPLAKLGEGAATALASFDVTVPFSRILESRSRGVKALMDGYAAVDSLPDARVLLVASSRFGWLGDGMVRVGSASGVHHDEKIVLTKGHHGTLLNDPEVYEHLERFLTDTKPA